MSGLISPIELKALQSVPGAMGLVRMVVGMEDPRNPPATLFENDFFYAWNRVKDSSRFEMNLEIPVGSQVKMQSIKDLAIDLINRPPATLGDVRCKQFDRSVDRFLLWLVKSFEVEYSCIGLINPENIIVLQWDGWKKSEDARASTDDQTVESITDDQAAEAIRVILPDMGFVLKAGGTLPEWLKEDNRYMFLWGDVPEKVYRRRYPEQWYLRVVARLIAFLLKDDCGVQSENGLIEPRVLNSLPKKAAAWDVLENALNGGFDELPDTDGVVNRLDAFRKSLVEYPASHHFSMCHEPTVGSGFIVDRSLESKHPNRRWLHASLSVLLLAVIVAVFWIFSNGPDTSCECCPEVRVASPIFPQLAQFDALYKAQKVSNGSSGTAPQNSDESVASDLNAYATSMLPIRSDGVAVELSLILDAEQSYSAFKTQNATTRLSVADQQCLDNLRGRYLEKLGNEYELVRGRLKPGLDKKSIAMLCQIKGELSLLSSHSDLSQSKSSEKAVPAWVSHFDRTCVTYRRWLRQCDSPVELVRPENQNDNVSP